MAEGKALDEVFTTLYLPLSPSYIICYLLKGGDVAGKSRFSVALGCVRLRNVYTCELKGLERQIGFATVCHPLPLHFTCTAAQCYFLVLTGTVVHYYIKDEI